MTEVENLCDELRDDAETRVVVFTGAGKHFSVGIDLRDPKQATGLLRLAPAKTARLSNRTAHDPEVRDINQITIAAINGGAVGGAPAWPRPGFPHRRRGLFCGLSGKRPGHPAELGEPPAVRPLGRPGPGQAMGDFRQQGRGRAAKAMGLPR